MSPITFDGYVDYDIIAASSYAYGLPGDMDIPREQALELAVQAIQETYGLDEGTVTLYQWICTFFDVTNPEKPLWRFLIQPDSLLWADTYAKYNDYDQFDDPQYNLRYRVEIDARTSGVVSIKEFKFQTRDWKNFDIVKDWY